MRKFQHKYAYQKEGETIESDNWIIQNLSSAPANAVITYSIHITTAIAPIPLAFFAGAPTSGIGKSFLK